jgi:hypothetical protein
MLHVTSGHAPGHIRDEFETLAEDRSAWPSPEMRRLIGRLWNCTDIMPSMLCAELDEPPGSTYAQGARSLRQHLRARLNRERDASASADFLLVIPEGAGPVIPEGAGPVKTPCGPGFGR